MTTAIVDPDLDGTERALAAELDSIEEQYAAEVAYHEQRIENLSARSTPATPRTTVNPKTAAARLGFVKPDGRVRDSFYRNVAPIIGSKIGGKWIIFTHRLDCFEKGELR